MKRVLVVVAIIGLLGLSWNASASPGNPVRLVSPDDVTSGYPNGAPYDLVAHGDGNDNFGSNSVGGYWIINDLQLSEIVAMDKYEFDDSSWETDKDDPDNTFSVNPDDATDTGTWAYTGGELLDGDSTDFELYFSIKTATKWNLFVMRDDWYEGSSISEAVTWSTLNNFFKTNRDDLDGKEISHISFWKGDAIPNAVPEPATLFLVGCGLIGLSGFGRKIKKNRSVN